MTDKNIPFGYQEVDGKPVHDPINMKYVTWLFETTNKYHEHPPMELVNDVIECHLEETGETLSYEDAEKLVLPSAIDNYLMIELNTKKALFERGAKENTPEALIEILGLPYDEAKQKYAALPPKVTHDIVGEYRPNGATAVFEPIISEELFTAVQQKLASEVTEEGMAENQGMKMF